MPLGAVSSTHHAPAPIVNFVRRAGEPVVPAPDGGPHALPHAHADDDYLRRHAPRSLACLPVRRLAHTVGVLYVENRRADAVFTAARLATLQALATQAQQQQQQQQ